MASAEHRCAAEQRLRIMVYTMHCIAGVQCVWNRDRQSAHAQ
jgi:hypothetical protein